MARKTFLYFLFNKAKQPLYLDDNGNEQLADGNYVKPDGASAHLRYSPSGWKDTFVKFARNIKYWGVFRDYTPSLKFVGDGMTLLRNQVHKRGGTEAVTHLGVMKLDKLNFPYTYKPWYLSELNFTKYKEVHDGVTIEALEGGVIKDLKANESTEYEIPCDEVSVAMDGMEFKFSRTYGVVPEQKMEAYSTGRYYVALTETSREGNPGDDLTWKDTFIGPTVALPNDNFLLRAGLEKEVRITGRIRGKVKKNITPVFAIEVTNNINPNTPPGTINDETEIYNQPHTDGQGFEFSFDETIVVPAGYQLYLSQRYGGNANGAIELVEGEITFEYVYRYRETVALGLFLLTLAQRLVSKMTDGQYFIKSDWLTAKKDIIVTCGDALRGLSNAVIKTSWNKFYQSLNARFGIGLGVENGQLVLEPLSYFFSNNAGIDLGEISFPSLEPFQEVLFHNITSGGPLVDYTDTNGKSEPNQGLRWNGPLKKAEKDLDLTSDYRSDPFGIEFLRINFEQKKTTDSESDNDTFLLHVKPKTEAFSRFVRTDLIGPPAINSTILIYGSVEFVDQVKRGMKLQIVGSTQDGIYTVVNAFVNQDDNLEITVQEQLLNEQFAALQVFAYNLYELERNVGVVTGVPYPETIFNVTLNGRQAVLNNGRYIRSILDQHDAASLEMTQADKNGDMAINGVRLRDKIQVGALGDRLFLPWLITFKTQVPVNLVELFATNMYVKVKFIYRNRVWYGYLFDGGIKPGNEDVQEWKILSGPENNLSIFNS